MRPLRPPQITTLTLGANSAWHTPSKTDQARNALRHPWEVLLSWTTLRAVFAVAAVGSPPRASAARREGTRRWPRHRSLIVHLKHDSEPARPRPAGPAASAVSRAPILRARGGVERVPVELLITLEEPGRALDEAGIDAAGETIGDHAGRLVLEPGRRSGEEVEERRGLLSP